MAAIAERMVAGTARGTATPSSRGALAGLSLAMLLSSLGTSVANVALPTLATSFGASFATVQWVVLAYLVTATSLSVGAGRLGDIVGRRRLLLAGIAIHTVASVGAGLAPSIGVLLVARAVQGIGAAIMTALALAFASETAGHERTGRSMGLLGAMSAVGTALGPSLGGALIALDGWRSIFLVTLPLGVAALVLGQRSLPGDRPTARSVRSSFEMRGASLLAATLVTYALALTTGGGRPGPTSAALLLSVIIGGALFARVESTSAHPLIDRDLLRTPALRSALGGGALVMTVLMSTLVVGPFFLTHALGFDAAHVGLVMTAGPVVAALVGVPAGRIVDRFGAGRATVSGVVAIGAGAALMATMPSDAEVGGYIARIVLITAGHGLFQAANNTAVMTRVRPADRGVAAGLLNLSRNLGLITGASVMGSIFAMASSDTGLAAITPESAAHGLRATYAVASLVALVALAITLATRRPPRHRIASPCRIGRCRRSQRIDRPTSRRRSHTDPTHQRSFEQQ